jgi:hypothetical protein
MIHRDGLIFLSISMIIFHLYFTLKAGKSSLKNVLIVIFFLLLIFLLRNFVFLALIPALTGWIITYKFPQKAFLSFLIVYIITVAAFFASGYISPKVNFPQYVANRQQSFIEIGKAGNSTIPVKKLEPNIKGFIKSAPMAFNLALMRPYLSKIVTPSFAPFALEIFLIEILLVLLIFFHKPIRDVDPVIYFILFLSITMLMMTGYTVPIIGAIVRYRSIYFIFLLIPVVCYIDWQKLIRLFNSKVK